MKKKVLLSTLFLLPFVVGCGAQTHTVEELKEVISKYEPINRNKFKPVTEGRAFGFDMNVDETKVPIQSRTSAVEWQYSKSVLFGVALKLDLEKFYVFTEYLSPRCQYYNIKGQLIDMDGSPTLLQSEIRKDGSIKFRATNSNNKVLNFGHYYPTEGIDLNDPYAKEPINEFSGKIDGCYVYDKYGYLVYEEFKTHTQNGPDSLTAKVSCEYSYYE